MAENALLRKQLIILNRQVKKPSFTALAHLFLVVLVSSLADWIQDLLILKPILCSAGTTRGSGCSGSSNQNQITIPSQKYLRKQLTLLRAWQPRTRSGEPKG